MKNIEARWANLIDLLKMHGTMSIAHLSEQLNVSMMTIRRDLVEMENRNLVKRSYGAASYIPDTNDSSPHYNLTIENTHMRAEKNRIGKYAASLVEKNDILIIDSGSTTTNFANYAPDDYGLSVLCYNLNIMNVLFNKRGIRLIMAGGYFHSDNQMCESEEGLQLIRKTRATKLILSASGIHEHLGMTTRVAYETTYKKAVMKSSQQKILLADSSKFGLLYTTFFAHIEELDIIVTDDGLSESWRNIIREQGVDLRVV
jgi:DeoR family deoxyribose operon repressor